MTTDRPAPAPPEGETLRKLFDNVTAMFAYWDADLRCRFANPAYQRWYGAPPEGAVGMHFRDLLGAERYRLNQARIEGALRGEPQEFEREFSDPAGGPERHGLVSYVPNVVGGAVRGFFVVVTDITGLKRAELALREAEEQFRLTLDEAPIGMALVAPDGRFKRVNRALCEIVGYGREELTGLTFQRITHPDDLDADLTLLGKLSRGEITRYALEKRYIRKDARLVDIALHVSVVRGPDGAPLHYIAQIEDITQRKQAARAERFLAEIGPVLAGTLDLEETLSRIARLGARELADFCVVELLQEGGLPLRQVASTDPAKAALCERAARVVLDALRPHPLRQAVELRRPVLGQHPTPEEVLAYAQSEEHRQLLEEAGIRSFITAPLLAHDHVFGAIGLVSSNPHRTYGPADVALAGRFAERAALSIENARLYQQAKQATQARDDVLGVVAHDLRNPLNNVLVQVQMLQRPSARRELLAPGLAMIERAARRMDRLIQDLLDVAKLEAGRLSVEAGRLAPRPLVEDAVASQRPLALRASVELRAEAARGLADVWADRNRLLQVLENLVGNALKFTPPGGRIVISAEPQGQAVRFSVADTGRGIAAADLPRLFDRFWQRTKGELRGAGLGLAITKGIVEALGGRIWVESVVGRGSTFSFTVPLAPGSYAFSEPSPSPAP